MKATPANEARTTGRQRCLACQYNHGDLLAVNEENKSSLARSCAQSGVSQGSAVGCGAADRHTALLRHKICSKSRGR
jgi:hypothetical protein